MSSTVTASARQFTRANSEDLSIASNSTVNFGDEPFYMCGWLYRDNISGDQVIVGKWDGSGTYEYLVYYATATGLITFFVSANGTGSFSSVTASTYGAVPHSTWVFWEAFHDPTANTIALCVNRGATNTTSTSAGVYAGAATFRLGGYLAASAFLSGRQQSVVLIDTAIPATADRDALYNSGSGVLYKDKPALSSGAYVSWWDGAETSGIAYDAHGTNHLTDNNTVTSAAGKVTYTAEDASQFTSANSESLTIANASAGDFLFGDVSFSASIWAYFDTNPANSVLIGLDNPTGSQRSWRIDMVSGVPRVILCPAGTTTGRTILNSTYTCPTGVWHMITVTYNATTDALRINVNDTTNTTGSHASGMFATSTANFSIGSESGNTAYLNGRATHASVWSRDLSDAEITQLYNRGYGLHYSDYDAGLLSGLISHWPLTESSGTRVDSVTASGNDLTDNNTVTGAAGVVYDVPAVVSSSTKSLALLGVG